MRSCIFSFKSYFSFSLFIYLLSQNYILITKILSTFKKSESGLSYTSETHCTVDNWLNFDETITAMDEEEFGEEDIHEFARLVEQSDRTWEPVKEELELINVGTKHNIRELKIGKLISADVRSELIALLQEYVDVFAWSYADMPGLDTDIVVHKLPLIEGCKPVK